MRPMIDGILHIADVPSVVADYEHPVYGIDGTHLVEMTTTLIVEAIAITQVTTDDKHRT